MEILSSGDLANLTNREADVAIRVVYDREALPLNLHGLKGPEVYGGVYMSGDRLAAVAVRAGRILSGGSPSAVTEFRTGRARENVSNDWDAVPDHGFRRGADRGGPAGYRHHGAPVLRRRCRSPVGEGARYRPAPVWTGLGSHSGRDTQDEARAAPHGVRIPQTRRATPRFSRGCPYRATDAQ
jgi:hypothetical protein